MLAESSRDLAWPIYPPGLVLPCPAVLAIPTDILALVSGIGASRFYAFLA